MNKYSAIIDQKTVALLLICMVVTYFCFEYNFGFNLNITLFSIAVVFPLVFTIREAFKRRDNALKFLSMFKSSMNALYYSFQNCNKLGDEQKSSVTENLNIISSLFFESLRGDTFDGEAVRAKINEVFLFIRSNQPKTGL